MKCRQRHRRARNRASKTAIRVPTECLHREGNTIGNVNASYQETRRSPRAIRTSRNYARENRETSRASGGQSGSRTGLGSQKHNPDRRASEESNTGVIPAKLPNKAGGNVCGGGGGGKAHDQGEHRGI